MSDTVRRLSAGGTFAELMPDLHYGVLAELEECLSKLLNQLQETVEANMNNPIESSNSPEPTNVQPPTQ